jgi:hypothetical protein
MEDEGGLSSIHRTTQSAKISRFYLYFEVVFIFFIAARFCGFSVDGL